MTTQQTQPDRRAFTLAELLVVIAIIAITLGVSFPLLRAMMRGSAESSGVNTVAIAVETTRHLATATRAVKDPLSDGGASSGTAMIVTNSGEIRLVQNDGDHPVLGKSEGDAYVDVEGRDYITLSTRTGVVGIKRTEDGLGFVAPPFAVRFNAHGNLVFGDPGEADGLYTVYYDGDYDDVYDPSRNRPNAYNPAASAFDWDPDPDVLKFRLPFDEIETVVGIMVFDNTLVPDLTADPGSPYIGENSDTGRLLLQHGTAVFFNRVTGAPVYRN